MLITSTVCSGIRTYMDKNQHTNQTGIFIHCTVELVYLCSELLTVLTNGGKKWQRQIEI
jgi:hypothetical protein